MLAVSFSSCLCRFIALFCVFGLLPTLHAQSTEADLKTRLMDKPLYLRGCWHDDKLRFDAAGHLVGRSDPTTFTLSGFEFKKARLKQDKLILEGRRVGLELAANKQQRVPVNVGEVNRQEDESVRIEVEASPTGDYGPALDAIFVDGLADLVPSLPFYWQRYAQKNFLPARDATNVLAAASPASTPNQQSASSQNTKPFGSIGGSVKPPKLLHSAEPAFSNAARTLKYSGNSLINLQVDLDGTPTHLSVVRGLGLGLDERALAAVQQYRFAPATKNGNPVVVELNVEVNFQIF
jgi:TonB family protein